jgi:O-antigen/teichoic acid export membrane protein
VAGLFTFVGSILGFAMTAAGRYTIQPAVFAAVALTEVVVCTLLVPDLGLRGAALGFTAGMVVYSTGNAIVIARVGRLRASP